MLVSHHAAVIPQVVDFVLSITELLILQINAHAMSRAIRGTTAVQMQNHSVFVSHNNYIM